MKIAIISDIHENEHNLNKAILLIKEKGITEVFALGDYINPGLIKKHIIGSGLKFRCIFGNNDGDKAKIIQLSNETNGLVSFATTEFDEYEVDGKKVFVCHYPEIARPVANSGQYNSVFYGHDHKLSHSKLKNGTLLLNPGEISGHITGKVTFAIWDSQTNEAEIVEIDNPLLTTNS